MNRASACISPTRRKTSHRIAQNAAAKTLKIIPFMPMNGSATPASTHGDRNMTTEKEKALETFNQALECGYRRKLLDRRIDQDRAVMLATLPHLEQRNEVCHCWAFKYPHTRNLSSRCE